MIPHKGFSNFNDSNCNIFWLTLVHIICAAVYNHKQCCALQRNVPRSPSDIFNAITTDSQVKSIFKIVLPNMSVFQTCWNRVTNYNDWCGRVLQKFFVERKCFLPPSLCNRGTYNLQLLVWLLLVKLRASLVIISVCVLYNFPGNKIPSLIFFVWKLILIS